MNTVITPKDVEEIVGNLDIFCNSQKENPKKTAVAFVRIIHEHYGKHYDYWAPICDRHCAALQAGRLLCNVCETPLSYKSIEWL
jgi:hypothetical protein